MFPVTLARHSYSDHPALDTAVSHAALAAVAAGEHGPIFRLHVPGRIVAFGRADRTQPGYSAAVRASAAHGFDSVERLAGGRAAVFHESTLAFSIALPDHEPRAHIEERFETVSRAMVEAFADLGVDARIGQLPGEYCPGQWSINVAGKVKVMGVGQRLVRGGAHVGGVVVVDGGRLIREVLIPVYRALGIDWDPRTSGGLADRAPGLNTDNVAEAIISAMGRRFDLTSGELPDWLIERARTLIDDHLPRVA